jgi:hypothetical protein
METQQDKSKDQGCFKVAILYAVIATAICIGLYYLITATGIL